MLGVDFDGIIVDDLVLSKWDKLILKVYPGWMTHLLRGVRGGELLAEVEKVIALYKGKWVIVTGRPRSERELTLNQAYRFMSRSALEKLQGVRMNCVRETRNRISAEKAQELSIESKITCIKRNRIETFVESSWEQAKIIKKKCNIPVICLTKK